MRSLIIFRQRKKEKRKFANSLGNIVELHYISGDNGLCGVYVKTAGGDTLYHAFTDYQSNLIALAGQDGGSVYRLAYDPWLLQFLSPDPYVQAPGNWLKIFSYL